MPRRSNGEGSIVQLNNGTWAGQYTFKGKRKAVYGKTKQEATKKLHTVLEEIKKGVDVDKEDMLLTDWLDYWLKYYAKPRVKRSTYISYEMMIRVHVKPFIGSVKFKNLSARIFQEYLVGLIKSSANPDGLSLKSVKNIKNMLHSAISQAICDDMLVKNYLDYVQLPKERKGEERVLTQSEQNLMVEEARRYPHEGSFGIILALYTGLRKGELLGLQWQDIDEEKRMLHVRRAINRLHTDSGKEQKNKTEIVIGSTKSSCSDRDIPLFEQLFNELMRFKERQIRLKNDKGVKHLETDFIITGQNFCHIEPRYFETIFQNVAKRAGVENVHIHTLRHTFATRCIEQGCDIYVLSKILGHAQPSTTLNKYGHALPDHKRDSMNKVGEIFYSRIAF